MDNTTCMMLVFTGYLIFEAIQNRISNFLIQVKPILVHNLRRLAKDMGDLQGCLQRRRVFSCSITLILYLVIVNGAEDPLMNWV